MRRPVRRADRQLAVPEMDGQLPTSQLRDAIY